LSDTVLFYLFHSLTLIFGIILSAAFCGVKFRKRTLIIFLLFFAACAAIEIAIYCLFGEDAVWKLYPLITHLPLLFVLYLFFKKRIITILASISLAYLCCQPAKWIGLLFGTIIKNTSVVWTIRIFVLLAVAFIILRYLAQYISEIFNKNTQSILIFASIPMLYYLFDYVVGIYTDLWISHYQIAAEFLAFYLCVIYMVFCVIYYKEYEKKADAERKEQILKVITEQQMKEVASIKHSNMKTSLLRHDMRLLLSNLALSIENNDTKTSLKMISAFVERVDKASVHRYCNNDTINYILSNYENKCKEQNINFQVNIEIEDFSADEFLFASIISNALDNAFNAQIDLPLPERNIKVMIKNSNGKLLLSVKNPFKGSITFEEGFPTTAKKGHGYGTQSIRYMTRKLGGNCQFSAENNVFILRIVL